MSAVCPARHAMAELSPWKGASMMELAKMYFQKRDFKAMITMSSRFNARVIEVYKKGQLTDDKLENYMVNYMTVPLLQEIDKMARGALLPLCRCASPSSLATPDWIVSPAISGVALLPTPPAPTVGRRHGRPAARPRYSADRVHT
jgi:hypothetical protein